MEKSTGKSGAKFPNREKGVEKSSPPSPPKVAINFLANRSFLVHLPFGARGGGKRKSFYQFVRAVPVSPPPFPCLDFLGKRKKEPFEIKFLAKKTTTSLSRQGKGKTFPPLPCNFCPTTHSPFPSSFFFANLLHSSPPHPPL